MDPLTLGIALTSVLIGKSLGHKARRGYDDAKEDLHNKFGKKDPQMIEDYECIGDADINRAVQARNDKHEEERKSGVRKSWLW